jgi:hypothetical protein
MRGTSVLPWRRFSDDLINPDFRRFLDEAKSPEQISKLTNSISRKVYEEIRYEFDEWH